MWAEPTFGCFSDDVPGQPQRIGQSETRRHAKTVDTGASKSKRFATKKVGTNVNPAELMTKPMPRLGIEQLMNTIGYEFIGQHQKREELLGTSLYGGLSDVKKKAASLAAATAT